MYQRTKEISIPLTFTLLHCSFYCAIKHNNNKTKKTATTHNCLSIFKLVRSLHPLLPGHSALFLFPSALQLIMTASLSVERFAIILSQVLRNKTKGAAAAGTDMSKHTCINTADFTIHLTNHIKSLLFITLSLISFETLLLKGSHSRRRSVTIVLSDLRVEIVYTGFIISNAFAHKRPLVCVLCLSLSRVSKTLGRFLVEG